MKTASGLTLITLGAIFTFAVTAHTPYINLQVAGVVLMLAGAAGLAIPRRGYGWLRRRMVVRRGPRGPVSRVEETRYPPYVMLNPGSDDVPSKPAGDTETMAATEEEPPLPGDTTARRRTGPAGPAEETVEEYFED